MTDRHHYERHVPRFGVVAFRPVEPDADAEVIHSWVSQERARFWGMRDADRERVAEIYRFVDSLSTHHAYLTLRDGTRWRCSRPTNRSTTRSAGATRYAPATTVDTC